MSKFIGMNKLFLYFGYLTQCTCEILLKAVSSTTDLSPDMPMSLRVDQLFYWCVSQFLTVVPVKLCANVIFKLHIFEPDLPKSKGEI